MKNTARTLSSEWFVLVGYFAGVFLLSLIVHFTIDKLPPAWSASTSIPVLKAFVFLLVTIALFAPIAVGLWRIWRRSSWRDILLPLGVAVVIFAASLILTYQRGPLGLGVDYSLRSESPFTQAADWQNTRLLMPALSYFLFLRGTWPFYAFFLLLVFCFISALSSWNVRHARLPLWEFLSLCTASFVAFHFQAPGYPDVLVYLLFLVVMLDDFSPNAKLSALLLALIAYESSFIVGLILAWRYLPRRQQVVYLLSIGIYGLIWLAVWHFDAGAILSSHNVEGRSGLVWVRQNPLMELLGLFMGYKALWAVIVWGGVSAYQSGRRREALFILLTVAAAVLMTFSAVDTSRLMGYAFPSLLISLSVLTGSASTPTGKRALALIFGLNLLIPSVYVGLNAGVKTLRGVYGRMARLIMR